MKEYFIPGLLSVILLARGAAATTCSTNLDCQSLAGQKGCAMWACNPGTKECYCNACRAYADVRQDRNGCDCRLSNICTLQSKTANWNMGLYVLKFSGINKPTDYSTYGEITCANIGIPAMRCTTSYACLEGSYGNPTDQTTKVCQFCPSKGTSVSIENTTIESCYVSTSTSLEDATGTYQYDSNCYYKE